MNAAADVVVVGAAAGVEGRDGVALVVPAPRAPPAPVAPPLEMPPAGGVAADAAGEPADPWPGPPTPGAGAAMRGALDDVACGPVLGGPPGEMPSSDAIICAASSSIPSAQIPTPRTP